ncbi:uncharacterized protein PAC_08905 [Phialocephala subalpina]|uniref:AAA+ ATPase domain-containing protein n=1 Tax=Phialocephala subalpina TaxID=576137 RepID=A0A1L7X1W5_9HELO|nr:uncharacterized protein PAC_08905 [Phialocephala subalpina]
MSSSSGSDEVVWDSDSSSRSERSKTRRKKLFRKNIRRELRDGAWKWSSRDPRKKQLTNNPNGATYVPLTDEDYALARMCFCDSRKRSYISSLGQKAINAKELEERKLNQNSLVNSEDYDIGIVRNQMGEEFLWMLSPLLRRILHEALKPKDDLLIKGDVFCLVHPYALMVGRRDELNNAFEKEETEEASQLWKVLDHTMNAYAPEYVWKGFQGFVRGDSVTYDQFWTIFNPGEKLIVMDQLNNPQILIFQTLDYSFDDGKMKARALRISLRSVVSRANSKAGIFGMNYTINVPSFIGNRAMTSLPVYPTRYAESEEDQAELERKLMERGRKWHKMVISDTSIWSYKGSAILSDGTDNFEGQGTSSTKRLKDPTDKSYFSLSTLTKGNVDNPDEDEGPEASAHIAIICPGIVKCVVVNTQKDFFVSVDDMTEVVWDENIFLNQLVLRQSKKDMLKGLVQNHLAKEFQTVGDFISRKGTGLIIVLHGPPGTGKTFAAESIAELVRRPLLSLSIGDLIADSKHLEERLDSLFDVCKEWKAILLLDEADVVLEARSIEDVRRNGIVSVFLRKLDYFEGIMFLTTNRIGTIDPAFMPRIQISILMDKLSVNQRRAVWGNFLQDGRLGLTEERKEQLEDVVQKMSKLDLNGRQIRNTFNIAQSFSFSRNGTNFITVQDLNNAAEQALEFQEYFSQENSKARSAVRSVWSSRF